MWTVDQGWVVVPYDNETKFIIKHYGDDHVKKLHELVNNAVPKELAISLNY